MIVVSAFYKFVPLDKDRLSELQRDLTEIGGQLGLGGLFLVAPEGINATVAGGRQGIEQFKTKLGELVSLDGVTYKEHECESIPFRRFKVDIRKEIITSWPAYTHMPEKSERAATFLTPRQWHERLSAGGTQSEKLVVLDTRNTYETALGVFRGAVDPRISVFSEFPEYVSHCGLDKDSTILMYCTGGVRCEKAALEMERQGFKNVFQLEGGILAYLEQYPDGAFEGECFVFDHRVAVDGSLQPSKKFSLCPHCGNPSTERIACSHCGKEVMVCESCLKERGKNTCSKNCQHHEERRAEQRR